MPAKDIFHDLVKHALEKEGWRITHEHYHIQIDDSDFFIDLAAEKLIAAEKEGMCIAVEVKSFLSPSPISDFHLALGQSLNYRLALQQKDSHRHLFLAVPLDSYETFFLSPFGQRAIQTHQVSLVVYSVQHKVITTWIK